MNYTPGEIARSIQNPRLVVNKLFKAYNHKNNKYNVDGISIFSEDWDNLIILDACRYDLFEKHIQFDGELQSRISRGSMTREFIRGNFCGQNHYDTIYCSFNQWYQQIKKELGKDRSEIFHFKTPEKKVEERKVGHKRELCRKTTEESLNLYGKYPNKRLIIHYVVPHEPYVDEDGNIIIEYPSKTLDGTSGSKPDTFFDLIHRSTNNNDRVCKKEITMAYESSVKYILDHVSEVVDKLDGLTVITSDHGELLGERMWPAPFVGFGHPEGVYMSELVRVPWFVCEGNSRRKITDAGEKLKSVRQNERSMEEVEANLRDLGYKI